jgi:hypothetical protein
MHFFAGPQIIANLPQFAAICGTLPQFATICPNLPQFVAICRNLLLICFIFLRCMTVFAGLTLAPPYIVAENKRGPKMGGSHFIGPSPPQKQLFLVSSR